MRLLTRIGHHLAFEFANQTLFETPYAILSHTWGSDEVNYQQILAADGGKLPGDGYKKILFAIEQAERDGIKHVWVDTCCIDKTSSAELSESINLMWKWYANSQICYVYLHGEIAGNRWFTRGWTLQELIAPRQLVFFCDEQRRGTRQELVDLLYVESGIDRDILCQQRSMQHIPLSERYRWAAGRHTTRDEDLMYCLLGILEVALPLNYGGGLQGVRQELLERVDKKYGQPVGDELRAVMLIDVKNRTPTPAHKSRDITDTQLLNALRFVNMASRRESIKLPSRGNCDWLLRQRDFKLWLEFSNGGQNGSPSLLWIKGHPGTGKSTLMRFADKETRDQKSTQIYFYFNEQGGPLERSAEGILRSFLAQLLDEFVYLRFRVCKYLQETQSGLPNNWTIPLLSELCTMVLLDDDHGRVRCYVDALDECDLQEAKIIIQLFDTLSQHAHQRFFVCFASRYYPALGVHACAEICLDQQIEHTKAIEHYIRRTLQVRDDKHGRIMRSRLISKAQGVFMWVVLVVQQLNHQLEKGRLDRISSIVDALPSDLNMIYHALIEKSEDIDELRLCVQLLEFSMDLLSGHEFYYAVLFGLGAMSAQDMREKPIPSTDDLRRFISNASRGLAELVPGEVSTVQFVHQSVREYLISDEGLRSLFCVSSAGPLSHVAGSVRVHDLASQGRRRYIAILTEYLRQLRMTSYQQGIFVSSVPVPGRPADLGLKSRAEILTWCVESGLPLVALVHNRLLWCADLEARPDVEQDTHSDTFLQDLDWSGLAVILELFQGDAGSHGMSAIGILAHYSARSLFERVFKLGSAVQDHLLGSSPVADVVRYGYPKDIYRIINRGLDINQPDREGITPIWRAMERFSDLGEDLACKLLSEGAQIDGKSSLHGSLLSYACQAGQHAVAAALITCGANIHERDADGRSPLFAYSKGCWKVDLLQMFLDLGAELNARDYLGHTPLMEACRWNSPDVVHLLIDRGANVSLRDIIGQTALFHCSPDVIQLLICAGADINAVDDNGNTALTALASILARRTWSHGMELEGVSRILALLALGADAYPRRSATRPFHVQYSQYSHGFESLLTILLWNAAQGRRPQLVDRSRVQTFDVWARNLMALRGWFDATKLDLVDVFLRYRSYLYQAGQWKGDLSDALDPLGELPLIIETRRGPLSSGGASYQTILSAEDLQ